MMKKMIVISAFLFSCQAFAEYALSGLADTDKRTTTEITHADNTNNEYLHQLEEALVSGWQIGNWEPCNKACGGGIRTRTVTCPVGFECRTTKPSTTQSCNTHSCSIPATRYCDAGWSLSGSTCSGYSCKLTATSYCAFVTGSCYSARDAVWDGALKGRRLHYTNWWLNNQPITSSYDGRVYKCNGGVASRTNGSAACSSDDGTFHSYTRETKEICQYQSKTAKYRCPTGYRLSGVTCYPN